MQDLEGLVVISVEQAVAGPYASAMLADAGARVIKVERPEGDFAREYDEDVLGQSAYFVWLNRGKESVCLDLRREDDRATLRDLAGRADVFIQNLKPGVLDRLGLGSESLQAAFPSLITCDISGFGASGPYATRKAYDLIIQAESGLCAITGSAQDAARVGISICDIGAGAAAHAAILQALFARTRSGVGRRVEISLFDAIAHWMAVPLLQYMYGGRTPVRAGVSHPTIAPYGAFVCKDGRRVILAIQNDREWRSFAERFLRDASLIADPRFATSVARVANRPALDDTIAAKFALLTLSQAGEALQEADTAYGCLNDLSDVVGHPQLRFVDVATPAGEVKVVAPAAKGSREVPIRRAVPTLGAQTNLIRAFARGDESPAVPSTHKD